MLLMMIIRMMTHQLDECDYKDADDDSTAADDAADDDHHDALDDDADDDEDYRGDNYNDGNDVSDDGDGDHMLMMMTMVNR